MQKKCGYVALIGLPNAGKSTLLNSCLKTKLAIVSQKPQTTRNQILGVKTMGENQIIFVDTPGMHRAKTLTQLNKTMNKIAWSSLEDADVVCYLICAAKGWSADDELFLKQILPKFKNKIMIILSQVDKLKKHEIKIVRDKITEELNKLNSLFDVSVNTDAIKGVGLGEMRPYSISAKRPEEVAQFCDYVSRLLPEQPWFFHEDDLTDKSESFVCSELIREQLFRQLERELPYQCGVKVDSFKTMNDGSIRIAATVVIEKESHKQIVIGEKGSRIKNIGIAARKSLEEFLSNTVHLNLFVQVQKGWTNNPNLLLEISKFNELHDI